MEEVMTMKLKRKNEFDFDGETGRMHGVSFLFRDFDYTHEQTLMLVRNGEAIDAARRNPLWALQAVDEGEMLDIRFGLVQRREQDSRDGGQRDRVKDVLGVSILSVSPHSNGNGKGS
jgi:hypothetical protein